MRIEIEVINFTDKETLLKELSKIMECCGSAAWKMEAFWEDGSRKWYSNIPLTDPKRSE